MTLPAGRPIDEYTGDGSTDIFAYTWKIWADTDLVVKVDDVLQTLTTHYTVTGAGTDGGGNVVFGTPPADTLAVKIYRELPINRTVDYTDGGPFAADTVDDDIDRTVALTQDLERRLYDAETELDGFEADVEATADSATAAATSETNAAASETNAATSETNAAASETNAASSAAAAAASFDSFDDRYLGAKSSDPATDNDGDALVEGVLYFNTTSNAMKVYDGAAWGPLNSTGDADTLDGIDSKGFVKFPAATGLNVKVLDIGDWDMDSTTNVLVTHGLSVGKIRMAKAFIVPDSSGGVTDLDRDGYIGTITNTVSLFRNVSGHFDSTAYDSTSFNRGWVTIWYVD